MTDAATPALLPPGTPIIYLEGKKRTPGQVYATGRAFYQLLLDDGRETYTTVPGKVIEAGPAAPDEATP